MKHILQGAGDFLKRYTTIFRAVWADRKSMESPDRTRDEIAFLPAHLELTETPVSPASRWTMRLIVALFCAALLWACIGKVDIVAVAPGKVVPSGRTKVIQSAETAVVKRILVEDGQEVKAGQLLVELDATGAQADVSKASDALVNARLARLRLRAIAQSLKTGTPPQLQADESVSKERWQAEQALAISEYAAFRQKQESLQATIAQRRAEIATIQSTLGPMAETARIAKTRETDYARLIEGNYVGRHDYLLRQQERIAAEQNLASQRSRLQEARSALNGAREQWDVLAAEFKEQRLVQLRQASEQIQQYAPEVERSTQRDKQLALRAPVDGTVQQLAIHTVGGVVTPAQALMAVVPKDDTVEVEATILNKDIGFIKPGQTATIKVESFPYTRYGYLTGEVVNVSHDAAQDERLGLVFPARVRIAKNGLNIEGVPVKVTPGMGLSVEIKTGGRRLISYLLSPLQRMGNEAGRER
ncbi:HlyD family type I secretion periplasmic adaptor subunit [Lysobacter pythonis]|uniref:Membrane fusion protein (MFP) family protein n=1 Tax=Solilutibacter pythonis TaxID=2483112 RepID=A0A3M2HMK0_9GAMM|nr:HlyD family type I secretion periplasmic adaptor subunit [Lysobacter pythonis]RMH90941.1 HlyD family type I secretion periplasmic adaptor subunit [Lysobacter pythonis]